MVRRSPPPQGLSRGQAIVIGLLSVVLLTIITVQFGGRKPAAASRVAQRTSPVHAASSPAASDRPDSQESPIASEPADGVSRTVRHWPVPAMSEVLASNPFRLPDELVPSRETGGTLTPTQAIGEAEATVSAIESARDRELRLRQAEFMAGLTAQGVDMILRSPRGDIARIGELTLRVGDIHEGLRVQEIGQDGVIFAPASAAEGQSD